MIFTWQLHKRNYAIPVSSGKKLTCELSEGKRNGYAKTGNMPPFLPMRT
jgi:hypothetical protein